MKNSSLVLGITMLVLACASACASESSKAEQRASIQEQLRFAEARGETLAAALTNLRETSRELKEKNETAQAKLVEHKIAQLAREQEKHAAAAARHRAELAR